MISTIYRVYKSPVNAYYSCYIRRMWGYIYVDSLYVLLHSNNGSPSVLDDNGSIFYHLDNIKHRLDGPAVIDDEGTELWHINGERVTDKVMEIFKKHDIPLNWKIWSEDEKSLAWLLLGSI